MMFLYVNISRSNQDETHIVFLLWPALDVAPTSYHPTDNTSIRTLTKILIIFGINTTTCVSIVAILTFKRKLRK